jgi:anion-transporting  ArsA/GET3 family ATPase
LHAAGLASELVLRNLGRVAGKAIVEDSIAFFRAFSGMEDGFRDRAATVGAILASPETAFVLVATPRLDAIREVMVFAEAIEPKGFNVAAAILNRVHPDFGPPLDIGPEVGPMSAWSVLNRNLADLHSIVVDESEGIDHLRRRIDPAPLALLPLAPSDIHDLIGLEELARRMLSGTVR